MNSNFLCPKCQGLLNVEGNVVFASKTKSKETGLILLHEQLGNYRVLKHDDYTFNEGEQINFYCPLCQVKLKSDDHDNFACIIMKGEEGQEFHVYFSEIAGEKSTFVLIGDNVEIYGTDAGPYVDFFNLSQAL